MTRLILAVVPILLLTTAVVAQDRRADHVVLVSVDGFRPDFYLEDDWPAPTLRQMAREGVQAEGVRGVFPTVTYPSHTTIVTGALPGRHGVHYNQPFEPDGQTGRWYWDYSAVQTETLWSAIRGAGGKSAGVSWPVTVGAPIDWLIPEVWSLDPNEERLAPMREATRPVGFFEVVEREATGRISQRNYSADWMTRDDVTGAAAAYILETYRPQLLAMHLISTDHYQHLDGRRSDRVLRAVGAADRAIGAVVEAADRAGILDRTAFIVTGDHGFVNVRTTLAPNVWLVEEGLMEAADDRGSWKASFHSAGGAAFLHLRRPNDTATAEKVRRMLANLPPQLRKLFRVIERNELDAMGATPEAELALAAFLGVSFTADGAGDAVRPGTGGTHGYAPADFSEIQTGFVGWGAGFETGKTAHIIGLEDIAPLISALLDLELEAPDGVAPIGLLVAAP